MKYIYIYIICFLFVFFPRNNFSQDIKPQLKQTMKLNKINIYSKNKFIKVLPRDGFIIKINGDKNRNVVITLEDQKDNNEIEIIEFNLEKNIIRLNNHGEGVFRIGALIAITNKLQPGFKRSRIKAKFKYID